MSEFTVGQKVNIIEPYVLDGAQEILLPGETLFVIAVPSKSGDGERYRVRCPASGADGWVSGHLLVEIPDNMSWQYAVKIAQLSSGSLMGTSTVLQEVLENLRNLIKNYLAGNFDIDYLRRAFEEDHLLVGYKSVITTAGAAMEYIEYAARLENTLRRIQTLCEQDGLNVNGMNPTVAAIHHEATQQGTSAKN